MVILRLPDSWSNWKLEVLVFEERRKPEYPEKNLSDRSKGENQQQTQPTNGVDNGIIEFEPHWWELSALITEPPLLPKEKDVEQTTNIN